MTVGDWLVSRTSPAASTVRGYAAHVRLYLGPYLGDVLLTELTTAQVQAMFTAIIRQHQALGTSVSAAALTRIRATLRAALNAAIRRGLITGNPAARAELPREVVWTPYRVGQWRRSGERPPVAVWTTAQTARFLDSVRWHRLYAACHLIALRGLRRGEAAELRWCDVDLDGKTAVISQQLQQYDGRLAVCPPKTPHSTRVIALNRTTVAALAGHRDRQRAEAAAYGPGYRDSGYVFTCLNGDPVAPDRLTRTFKKLAALAALAALPPVRLHHLRHGAASLALSAGVELKVVQEMLGHSSIVLTAGTRTSVLPDAAHAAAEKVADLIIKGGCLVPGTRRRRRGRGGPVAAGRVRCRYAFASASCTLAVLLSVVSQALTAGTLTTTIGVFAAYAAGSAVLLLALAAAATLAEGALSVAAGRLARHLPRISGALLAASGLYLVICWLPALVRYGARSGSGPLPVVSGAISAWIVSRENLVAAIAALLVIAAVLAARRSRPGQPDACCAPGSVPAEPGAGLDGEQQAAAGRRR